MERLGLIAAIIVLAACSAGAPSALAPREGAAPAGDVATSGQQASPHCSRSAS